MEQKQEVLTDPFVEGAKPELLESSLTRVRTILELPLWNAISSALKWKLRALAGWTGIVGAAVAGHLLQTGQLLFLQAGELAVVWFGFSLPILMVPYSKHD